jgi:hypothetical protein
MTAKLSAISMKTLPAFRKAFLLGILLSLVTSRRLVARKLGLMVGAVTLVFGLS